MSVENSIDSFWQFADSVVRHEDEVLASAPPSSSGGNWSIFEYFQRQKASTASAKPDDTRFRRLLQHLLQYRGTVLTWVSMALAVLSGSAVGPIFKFMENHGVAPLIAASWRNQSMLVFLLPVALCERYMQDPAQRQQCALFVRRPDLQFPVYVHVLIAGVCWTVSMLSWTLALQYTTTVRASILASLHTLFLVLVIHWGGGHVSRHEWVGVMVVLVGVIVIGSDGLFDPTPDHIPLVHVLLGDGLCLLSSFAQCVIILNRSHTKQYVAVMQYTAMTTGMIVLIGSAAAMIFEGATLVGGMDDRALLGWLNDEWRRTVVCFGLLVGVVCIAGFNYASGNIAPLVFSAFTLLDPALTGVISWVAGLEEAPDLTVWTGGVIVLGGVALLTYGEHLRQKAAGGGGGAGGSGTTFVTVAADEELGQGQGQGQGHDRSKTGNFGGEDAAGGMRRRSSNSAFVSSALAAGRLSQPESPTEQDCDGPASPLHSEHGQTPGFALGRAMSPDSGAKVGSRGVDQASTPDSVAVGSAGWLAPVREAVDEQQ